MSEVSTGAGLLPCPFCGSEALLGIVTEGGEANPDFGGHFVQCNNERCHGCMGLRFACGDDPRPALVDAWNKRATPEPAGDLVETIAKAMMAVSRPNANPDDLTPAPRGTIGFVPKWQLFEHLARAAITAMPDRAALARSKNSSLLPTWRPIRCGNKLL
jgi:hypothetical protein